MTRADILTALETLYQNLQPALPEDESGEALRERFESTLSALNNGEEYLFLAEELLTTLITYYPNLTMAIPRDLLWAVGGSCLHFMGDEEIEAFSGKSGLH